MIDLNRYTDLTPNQVGFLRDPARAHPAARAAFIKDGLLRQDGTLSISSSWNWRNDEQPS